MQKLPKSEIAPVRRNMFLFLLFLVTLLFFGLIFDFLMACFWAAIFAILFQGVNSWLINKFNGRKNLSAFLTALMIMLVVVLPIGLVSVAVVNESQALYQKFEQDSVSLDGFIQNLESKLPMVRDVLSRFGVMTEDIRSRLETAVGATLSLIGQRTWSYTQGVIKVVVDFFLMLYLLYFWVRDGQKIVSAMRRAIPVGDEIEDKLFRRFAMAARATLRGTVIIAACQGLMGGILFALVGIQAAVLWGVLMGLLSLLPVGGSGIVWVPAAVIMFIQGYVTEGIVILVVGALGIGLIDNILRPLLVGRGTRMPDYLILLATLGGITWVGLTGFIIGPVLAVFFITCWEITGDLFGESHKPPEVEEGA